MEFLFFVDPLEGLNRTSDTTWALMESARTRGHRTFVAEPSTLTLEKNVPSAPVREVIVEKHRFSYLDEAHWREVASFPLVWLRTDPPFDMRYVTVTWLLEQVDGARCLVINHPVGVRSANEKLYALRFPDICPPTLVTSNRRRIWEFIETHREVVLKPLDGFGGRGILFASANMRGLAAIIEAATRDNEMCEVQLYLPQAPLGDKRVLLLDGEPLGAILRLAARHEDRNNLHLGGSAHRAEITPVDQHIIERLRPSLRADGLVFVGIDIIGGLLTEVNVTSPTGIQELEELTGLCASARVIQWCEARAPGAAALRRHDQAIGLTDD